jgi:hypothetical protein
MDGMTVRSYLAFTVLLAAPVSAQTTIETISFWDGLMQVQPFGKPNTATYGQTFVAPASDNVLNSFSFFLRDLGGGADLEFQGYVAAFDPTIGVSRIVGSTLFESAVRSGPSTTASFTRYDFDVGGLALTPGSTYVAFLSTSGHFGAIPLDDAIASWGQIQTAVIDPYVNGHFVFNNNGDDFSQLSTVPWISFDGADLAFELQFTGGAEPSVVPEPSTVLLMGTGMGILLLGVVRRRRRNQAAPQP